MIFDVAIVGSGPAGSACASFCAAAGRTTLLLERAQFPREKVCGDCLNPGCWSVLDRLGVSEQLLAMPHAHLANVTFVGLGGESLRIPLPRSTRGEIAIKRSLLDHVLVERAVSLGAEVRQNAAVTELEHGWRIHTTHESFRARVLVAADGRNSTVARLLGLLPATKKERVGLQTIAPASADLAAGITLRFLPDGYCGMAPVGNGELNVCLVARPASIGSAKKWATEYFGLDPQESWRTVTPLTRPPARAAPERLLLVGDAARVVEPFTGEGIYYALASGELAARCILAEKLSAYSGLHAALYRGRLWINQLARFASLHPRLATQFLRIAQRAPRILTALTRRVVETETLPGLTIAAPVSARK